MALEALLGSLDNFILKVLIQVDEIGAEASHPYYQVLVFFRMELGFFQGLAANTVKLDVIATQVKVGLD